MKFVDGGNFTHHVLEFKTTVRELKSIGAKREEMDLICHLLLTLPKSFESLATALETMNPEMLNMEFVKSRLFDERNKENNRKPLETVDSNNSVAMNAKVFKFKCFHCGEDGHKRTERPKLGTCGKTQNRSKQVNIAGVEEEYTPL